MKLRHRQILTGLVLATTALPVFAHPGHDASQVSALFGGLAHPFTGLDHLLAMLAVGFAAAQMKRAIVPMTLAFIAFMLLGGIAGLAGTGLLHVETGIALSVLVLGGVLVAARHIPTLVGAALVALFAIFHGQAHGAEMPLGMNPYLYFLGFAVATLSLHLAGYAIGKLLQRNSVSGWPRFAGAGTAGVGILMLLGLA